MKPILYQRTIHVYETDLMGIVHHSNYLRFCEEARVAWFENRGFSVQSKDDIFGLVVVETRVQHKFPLRYGEKLSIQVQVQPKAARLIMQYRLFAGDQVFAFAETVHCRIDQEFKVQRLDQKLLQLLKEEKWIETWL